MKYSKYLKPLLFIIIGIALVIIFNKIFHPDNSKVTALKEKAKVIQSSINTATDSQRKISNGIDSSTDASVKKANKLIKSLSHEKYTVRDTTDDFMYRYITK